MSNEMLKKTILELEMALMSPEVRRSAEKIEALLAADFVEHCSSGKVYRYAKGDVFTAADLPRDIYDITDFAFTQLGDDAALATYRATRIDESGAVHQSLRSSIWRRENGDWKMAFHQGTPVP